MPDALLDGTVHTLPDDLRAEIKKKTAKGYPLSNTIFED